MNKDILKQNKLPGCDQFTRPEEIKALSKYLGHIKKVQEEHTTLEKNNLEVPGKKSNIPKIDSLIDHLTKLDNDESKELELSKSKQKLSPKIEQINLDNTKLSISEDYEIVNLDNTKLSISEDYEIVNLDNTLLKIDDNLNQALSNNRIDLLNDSKGDLNELPEKQLKISDKSNIKLDNTKLSITNTSKELELSKSKQKLSPDLIKTNLDNTKLNLLNTTKNEILGSKKVDMVPSDKSITNLENFSEKEILKVNNDISQISNYHDILIKPEEEINLQNTKENLEILNTDDNIITSSFIPLINIDHDIKLSKELEELDINFSDIELSETILNISDNVSEPEELIKSAIDLGGLKNELKSLSTTLIDLNDDKEIDLSTTLIDLNDDKEINLSTTLINLDDDKEIDLSTTLIDLNNDKEIDLSKDLIELYDTGNKIIDLETDKINLTESENKEWLDPNIDGNQLYDSAVGIKYSTNIDWFDPDFEENQLYETITGLEESKTHTWIDPKDNNKLYSNIIKLENFDFRDNELSEDKIELNSNNQAESLDTVFDDYSKKLSKLSDDEVTKSIDNTNTAFIKTLEGDDLYYKVLEFAGGKSEWEQKIQSLMSAYLSSSKISPERAEEYENKLDETRKILEVTSGVSLYKDNDTLKDTKYKLPDFNLGMLNPSAFLRWAAENTIGALPIHGSARELLLNETLALLVLAREKLEKSTKSNRDRLPGDDGGLLGDLVSGGVSGAVGKAAGRVASSITGANKVDMSQPINRPKTEKDEPKPTTGWTAANDRVTVKSAGYDGNSSKSLLKKVKDKVLGGGGTNNDENYKFSENYLAGEGIKTTLEELCGDGVSEKDGVLVNSVDQLFDILRSSPYMTTPEKFTTTKKGGYKAQTLDSNSFWEIKFEPYVGMLNGNYSYLPALHEINTSNIIFHGVGTGYNKWIPFTSFDLQKTKLSTKTLGLFDGEIVYPVSMEFLNELRFTIADDQYKSWRTYFERCMEVAVYNSEPHELNYYKTDSANSIQNKLTAVDKSHQVVAMYKNLAFRCVIYVMTPQKSAIRKFDLLLVLKDFSEEYSGDIDSGGSDLTITFSIVGENPPENMVVGTYSMEDISKGWEEKSKRTDYSSMANKSVSSVMKIL